MHRTLPGLATIVVVLALPAFSGTITLTEGNQGTLPTKAILPAGTTTVNGVVSTSDGQYGDYFEFVGLPGGVSFTSLNLTVQDVSGPVFNAIFLTGGATFRGEDPAISGTHQEGGTVPLDGNLLVEIQPSSLPQSTYQVTLQTSQTPEPATFTGIGLGLAGIGAFSLRRRKKTRSSLKSSDLLVHLIPTNVAN
jgi:PEP-CTERM motif